MKSIWDFITKNKNIKGVIFNGSKFSEIIKRLYPNIVIETDTVKGNCKDHKIQLFTLDGIKCI